MPNLPAHMDLAKQVAQRLDCDVVEANMGCYLLGSTSPDIRIITRRRREEYHFTTLDFKDVGAGVQGLFEAHPGLRVANGHSGPTQAFVAGYITHLIADETWISRMFRPFFGNRDVFEDETYGLVLDRVMQLELDRQSWDIADSLKSSLATSTSAIDIDFIESQQLTEWAQWIISFIDKGFAWERLHFMARRIASGDESHPAFQMADEFVADVSQGMEHLEELVPLGNLDEYKRLTFDGLVEAVGNYLS